MAGFRIKVELQGVQAALRKLADVKRTTANKILRAATNDASRPILAAARGLVPVGKTGMLKKSLAVKVKTYRASGTVVAVVGPRTGMAGTKRTGRKLTAFGRKAKALGVKPSNYAHLVERGHRLVRGGRDVGTVAPKPFLRPGFEAAKQQAAAIFAARVAAELNKLGR